MPTAKTRPIVAGDLVRDCGWGAAPGHEVYLVTDVTNPDINGGALELVAFAPPGFTPPARFVEMASASIRALGDLAPLPYGVPYIVPETRSAVGMLHA